MPASISIEVRIENEQKFIDAIRKAKEAVGDLRIPLTLIAKDFYKSEKAIFQLKGPGQYQDLVLATKTRKQAVYGRIYPILYATGRLKNSVLNPKDVDAINEIINRDTLLLGTRVPYAPYHQHGTSKMASRPFFFIGPEAPAYATSDMKGRPERWLNILREYVLQKIEFGEKQNG